MNLFNTGIIQMNLYTDSLRYLMEFKFCDVKLYFVTDPFYKFYLLTKIDYKTPYILRI